MVYVFIAYAAAGSFFEEQVGAATILLRIVKAGLADFSVFLSNSSTKDLLANLWCGIMWRNIVHFLGCKSPQQFALRRIRALNGTIFHHNLLAPELNRASPTGWFFYDKKDCFGCGDMLSPCFGLCGVHRPTVMGGRSA
ncbi:hypothetical protein [Thiolapillus brandeum]|uniref:hypothetical protein n=1 Tax=Thiolapillus brandeum TaxID=1076588 RepID=UPI00155A52E5|nr:hypothetical protein [Thiolapillus brandeum]